MAIKVNGVTVINNDAQLGAGLSSAYDTISIGATATITNRELYYITGAGSSITLPASPNPGNEVVVVNGGAFTDAWVLRNGSNIMGQAQDLNLDIEYASINFIYVGISSGWIIT